MSTLTQFLGGKPRRARYTITASNASFPIPAWAQGGTGVVLVSGCAGGSSGAIDDTVSQRGPGGSTGGQCLAVPIYIETGVTTAAIVVGLGGTSVTASADTSGNAGGDTTITVGTQIVTLKGGLAPTAAGTSLGGNAHVNIPANVTTPTGEAVGPGATPNANGYPYGDKLIRGARGGAGTAADPDRYGAGASGLFGRGGGGLSSAPANGATGANATGYGAGGAGANCTGPTSTTSGAGSPGIVFLEFVEGTV